jgi:hypothetical protein
VDVTKILDAVAPATKAEAADESGSATKKKSTTKRAAKK